MTWIKQTGQQWKLYVALAFLATALLCFVLAITHLGESETDFGIWLMVAVGLFWMAFLWTVLLLRCPHCQTKIVWRSLRTLPHQDSIQVALFLLVNCPKCGRHLGNASR